MTNDNIPPDAEQRRLQQKYADAIAMVGDMFLEAGLHPAWMIEPLKEQVAWAENAKAVGDQQR